MGVVNLNSTMIGNQQSSPIIESDSLYAAGVLKETYGFVTAGAADSIGSTYRFCQVPSNARVSKILLSCGSVTSAAGDIGVYDTLDKGGAAISVALFAAGQSIATPLSHTDVTDQGGTYPIAAQEQPLWQAAGLLSDPQTTFDLVMTLTIAATGSADCGLKVEYV